MGKLDSQGDRPGDPTKTKRARMALSPAGAVQAGLPPGAASEAWLNTAALAQLSEGDTIELLALQTSGTPLPLLASSWLAAARLA